MSTNATVRADAESGLRVLYVCHVSELGGAEWSLIDLVHGMRRYGHTPVVALPKAGPLAMELRRARAEVVFCRALGRLRRKAGLSASLRLMFGMQQLRCAVRAHSIDLIHANSATAGLFSLAARRPLVWHVRDLVAGPETAWLARRAALSIAPSRACARLLRLTAPAARVAVVPNGVEVARFTSIKSVASPSAESLPLAVAIGHLAPWKGHELLLQAVRLVRRAGVPLRLLVVGGDPFDDRQGSVGELQRRVDALGLTSSVQLIGAVSDVSPWLARASLTIHAAYPEPFGRVVVESMAAGVPVVAFAGEHGPAEILANGEGGWLAAERTPHALAAAIIQAFANPRDLRARGERAQREAILRYDRQSMAALIANEYRAVLRNDG